MPGNNEQAPTSNEEPYNVCFINPALVPNWFWLPTAHLVEEQGHNYFIPELRRGDPEATVDDNVDIIEATMDEQTRQFVVVLSRGIEFGVRYLNRLNQKADLGKVLGWMVISSVGPRGYEINVEDDSTPLTRHTPQYMWGLSHDSNGLEVMDPSTARTSLLHDLHDERLRETTVNNLLRERPLSKNEVAQVPTIEKSILPLSWYIGRNDRVDNTIMSAAVAKQKFGVEPEYTDWGHVGPLSHAEEVAEAIVREAERAVMLRQGAEL